MMIKTKQVFISKKYSKEEAEKMFSTSDYTNNGDWKLVYMEETSTGYAGLMVQTEQGKIKENDSGFLEKVYRNYI